jgi:hypothetical protein
MVLSEQNLDMCVRLAGGWRRVLICSERKDCWLIAREKYCWLVADKPSKQGHLVNVNNTQHYHLVETAP